MSTAEAIRQHWDQRAALGPTAGTQDLLLKELEHRAILAALDTIRPHVVLEVGCGQGELARAICRQYPGVDYLACDSSRPMILAAKAHRYPTSRLHFTWTDAETLPKGIFDTIITERCLINLPNWETQQAVIAQIATRLAPGGHFLMCEHSQDGLDALNAERERFRLRTINPPFHNRYFRDAELATVTGLQLVTCDLFSARYYYHSRVVNAWLANQEGREPDYQASVNLMALESGAPFTFTGAQGRLWIWKKC